MAKVTTKDTQLESVLREMVRDVIVEELTEIAGDLVGYDDWKTRTPDEPGMPYFEPEDMEDQYGEMGRPDNAVDAHMQPGPEVDPELGMDPREREAMINSLLDMEFQESAHKSIPVSVVREMIRESVRKHMKK